MTLLVHADHHDAPQIRYKQDLYVNGWYVTLSYLLTGEDAQRNKPVRPLNDFNIKEGGWGAFELLGRYEQFWLGDGNLIENGIATGSDAADALTLGLTWWPNIHLKFMLNYVYTYFDETITVSDKEIDHENVMLMRGQFNF
jgi:phosphate-selective porin OprO/OprP